MAVVVGVVLTAASVTAPAWATPPTATYTISIASTGTFPYQDDTPASPYIDKDGTFYFQESDSLYGASASRSWNFYSGTDFDTATKNTTISGSVNPSNSSDSNADTTWRCDNSPTGLTATSAPSGSSYSQPNFCDLVGVWVDPDTGDWYGLVHNEFTPQPFGDGLHYDAIDYAVSHDQGMTWTIEGHAITSPYSTTRGDTTAFPNQTYDYGDGDPRLYADTVSGYFYLYYGSRIVDMPGATGNNGALAHVARCPMASKMATGCWEKWYNGTWSQPGVGGLESNMVEVDASDPTGYTAPAGDYSPASTGSADQQVAAGTLPSKSNLFIMNITYDAYLGLYIGEPEHLTTGVPQRYVVTDDLSTQKWYAIGDTGSSYTDTSWYRWMVDSVNKTSSTIVGKTFRSYCAVNCVGGVGGLYENVTVDSTSPAAPPVDTTKTYTIGTSAGRVLAQVSGSSATTSDATATGSALESWSFASDGDGSYRILNASTGQALGVDSTVTTTRAWGTAPTVTALGTGGPTVGQQWFILGSAGSYRIVNRYSGLVIALSSVSTRLAETTPARSWTDTSGTTVGGGRTAAEQTLTLTATGAAAESVLVTNPGSQSGAVGTAVSLQIAGSDSQGNTLTYSATGLPSGLSISSSGLIAGTPTTAATSSVTVTATSGTASGTTTFSWTVNPVTPNLTGTHTISISGEALQDPGSSTALATQLDTSTLSTGANQNWTFTLQSDGSYTLTNGSSGQCANPNGAFTTAGTAIIQYTCNTNVNQHWKITALANGSYTFTSVHSGLLMTTASTAVGALVTQQANTGSTLQEWTIT